VIDEGRKILGVFTDGDLRRLIETGNHPKNLTAGEVMSTKPKTIRSSALAVEAAELMEKHQITSIFVVDANMQICGALNSNDLMRAKVI
jgi:arabinose-5-phosphate isomerase